eukprot:3430054-Rhodomonas_salina.2
MRQTGIRYKSPLSAFSLATPSAVLTHSWYRQKTIKNANELRDCWDALERDYAVSGTSLRSLYAMSGTAIR